MYLLSRLAAGLRAFANRVVSFIPSWYDYAITHGEILAFQFLGIGASEVPPQHSIVLRIERGVHADIRVRKLILDASDPSRLGVTGIWVGTERLPYPVKTNEHAFLPVSMFAINSPRSPDLEHRLAKAGEELRVEVRNFGPNPAVVSGGFVTDELSPYASIEVKGRFRDNVRSPLGLSFV